MYKKEQNGFWKEQMNCSIEKYSVRNITFILSFISILILTAVQAQQVTVIKLATLAPEGTDWHGKLVEMGIRWQKATNGAVKLRIYPSGVVGDERDMIRKIRLGQIHAAAITTEGLSELNPEVYAYLVPMLFNNYEDVDWVREQISPELVKGINKSGFTLLYWVDVGWAYWFSAEAIRVPEDLKKMKIFNWAGDFKTAEIWRKGGFNPVPLALIDVLSGLQTGLIDAVTTSPLISLSMQWFGVANHMLDLKWGLVTGGIVIDNRVWDKIRPEHQNIMLEIASEIGDEQQLKNRYEDQNAINVMKEYGLTVYTPTVEEFAQWKSFVESWYPNIRGTFIPAKIFDRVIELKKQKDELSGL
ncbi:MAG: TRAP transporter substrate-binding protein DctP [Candidatus Neomarinimicrobiota bacterium]